MSHRIKSLSDGEKDNLIAQSLAINNMLEYGDVPALIRYLRGYSNLIIKGTKFEDNLSDIEKYKLRKILEQLEQLEQLEGEEVISYIGQFAENIQSVILTVNIKMVQEMNS